MVHLQPSSTLLQITMSTNSLKCKFDKEGFINTLLNLPADKNVNELEHYLVAPVKVLPARVNLLKW